MPQHIIPQLDLWAIEMARVSVAATLYGGRCGQPSIYCCSVRTLKGSRFAVVGKLAGECRIPFRTTITVDIFDQKSGRPVTGKMTTTTKSGLEGIVAEVGTTYFRLFDCGTFESYEFGSKPVEDGIFIGFENKETYPAVRCPQYESSKERHPHV